MAKPFSFETTRAACLYDEASREIILKFKHGDQPELAKTLGQWLSRAGREVLEASEVIMPVPLHPLRLWQWRYNQAAELGRIVAKAYDKPMIVEVLQR